MRSTRLYQQHADGGGGIIPVIRFPEKEGPYSIIDLPVGVGGGGNVLSVNTSATVALPVYTPSVQNEEGAAFTTASLIENPDQLDVSQEEGVLLGSISVFPAYSFSDDSFAGGSFSFTVNLGWTVEAGDYATPFKVDTEGKVAVKTVEYADQTSDTLEHYQGATATTIFPNTETSTETLNKLESVGIYKAIDLLCEGPIEGLCDMFGNVTPLTTVAQLNENAFKGVYLNDVPVKNSTSDTLNYIRIYAEFKKGTLRQKVMSSLEGDVYSLASQKSLSFGVAAQTFNKRTSLPGLNKDQFKQIFTQTLPQEVTGPINADTTTEYVDTVAFYAPSKGGKSGDAASLYKFETKYEEHHAITSANANDPAIFTSRIEGKNQEMVDHIAAAININPVKFQHVITNDAVTDVEVNFSVDQLGFRNTDDPAALPINNTLVYMGKISYVGDERLLGDGGSAIYLMIPITGVATTQYMRAGQFKLPPSSGGQDRQVTFVLASQEPTAEELASGKLTKRGGIASITEIVDLKLTYPHSALMGTLIDARAFSGIPKRSYDVKLAQIQLPDNYDPNSRTYRGNWGGEFGLTRRWSNNPAWVFYDMITNPRYGLGKYGFDGEQIDKWTLYSISKYCDELVETGYQAAETPLDFKLTASGAVVYISDSVNRLGSTQLRSMFPPGGVVALYKLKKADGTEIRQGYRRRIGTTRFLSDPHNRLEVSIHDVFNVVGIFRDFPSLVSAYNEYRKTAPTITPNEWLLLHLNQQQEKAPKERDAFSKEFSQGFGLPNDITEGKIVVEKQGKPVLEPRFTANIYFDKEQEAFNLLNDLAAIFRGMVYWNNGYIFASSDQYKEAIMVFNNTSVKDGVFTYSGSSKTTRFTSALVRYNDQFDSYKPKVEYVEDAPALRKYGYLEKKVVALGVTSRTQAQRLGKWLLYTNQLETDLVQFTTGTEVTCLRPGDVIKIQDNLKSVKRYGGRIKGVTPANFQLTLDKGIYEDVTGEKITLITPRPQKAVRELSAAAVQKLESNDRSGFSQAEVNETHAPQITQFTISSVGPSDSSVGGVQNDLVTVTDSGENDFSNVKIGTIWSLQNTTSSVEIEEIEYRVISITEQSPGQYMLTALMYESSKFDAIDQAKNLSATQQSKSEMTIIADSDRPSALPLEKTEGGSAERPLQETEDVGEGVPYYHFRFTDDVDGLLDDFEAKDKMKKYKVDFTEAAQGTPSSVTAWLAKVTVGGETKQAVLSGRNNTIFYILIGSALNQQGYSYDITPLNKDGVPAPDAARIPPGGITP